MAEFFLGSVVDSILGHAVSLAAQEIQLVCSIKGELKKLETTASAIAALLREADRRPVHSEVVKNWLEKLSDVVYNADDLLDDYSTEALRQRRVTGRRKWILNEVRAFFSPSNQIVYAYKMARRVMEIRENINAITDDRVRFQLEEVSSSCPGSLVENPVTQQTPIFKFQPDVIGRDNDKKEVMEFLLDNNHEENVPILAIMGLGGLGKTTLARLVFNDERAKENFPLRFWVCVSTNFIVEDILRKILRKFTFEKLANLDMYELQEKLREKLGGKRFLLILDDVWNENSLKWLELRGFLMSGAKGSKILVTTRTHRVAKIMTEKIHELRGLPEPESLSLLMRVARKKEHEWRSQNLEMIGKEILKKCAGVPLAIMTIAGFLLSSRNTEEDWMNFKNNDLSRIHQEEGSIMPSLRLSYDYLPPHLKQCFAYCSLFPKDYRLNPSKLIHLWIAQGFIKSPSNNKTLEELGHDYFMELLSRSFFHCVEEDEYGDIIQCEMHDLMHDLAQLVAGDSCISISSTADVEKIKKGARHVCVVGLEDDGFKGFERDGRIRSLLFAVEVRYDICIPNLDVSCFRNLRALRLQGVGVEVISNSIGKLKHLRSLDLSLSYYLKSLPDSISCLCNLESLNLRACVELERLPRGLTKLVNLRHLDVADCYRLTHMPRGIGRLTTLQTLSVFAVREKGKSSGARLNELSRLVGLRKELTIQNLENLGNILDEVDTSFSMAKIALQSLKLRWGYNEDRDRRNNEEVLERLRPHPNLARLSIRGYGGSKISTWASQLHKLAVIEISNCDQCKHLPPLDHLHFLQRITLSVLPNLQWIELLDSGTLQCSFPSLEELELTWLSKFKGWDQRRRSENGLEQGIQAEEEDSLLMLIPAFSEKIKVSIWGCPTFSYLHGQHLHLMQITNKILQEQLRISSSTRSQTAVTITPMMTLTPISSISLAALTGLTIGGMEDVEHLPMNLIQSCSSLKSLTIEDCPRLKSLSLREILQYLDALEMLEISRCDKLDLSIVNDDDDNTDAGEGMDNLQLRGHSKLRRISISNIHKLSSSPFEWILCFPNLETLEISRATCWSEDQDDMSSSQFSGSTKLRELTFGCNEKMETLPGWIQHLTSLESLRLYGCSNIKALPRWFPKLTSLKTLDLSCREDGELWRRCQPNEGEDWPKISHVERVIVQRDRD